MKGSKDSKEFTGSTRDRSTGSLVLTVFPESVANEAGCYVFLFMLSVVTTGNVAAASWLDERAKHAFA